MGKLKPRKQPELREQIKGLHAQTSAMLLAVMALASSTAVVATDFSDIDQILRARCVICHAGPAAPLGLSLDSRDGLLAGSSRGAIVAAADPGGSELIKRLKGTSLPRMPMTGPPYLTNEEVALFEQWILDGMRAGAVSEPSVSTPSLEPLAGPVRYDQVAPIFATRCVKCHTENGLMGGPPEGYRLASYASTISAADRVRVVPGNPEASELVRRIRGQALPRMPFDGPPFLTDKEIGLIEQWIADGAMDSAGSPAPVPVGSRVRLHGTLASSNLLDDLPVVITASTRLDKSPGPGDYVEVRGTLDADGRVVVDRMRPRQ
jgi:mono/diheme cytochrome c family protein